MKVYGPDGTEYPNYEAAIAAGVTNISTIKPTPRQGNIPTYGFELQRLMSQYGVNSPVAPRTNDQSLIDQYFQKTQQPMYSQPTGNDLYNTYLGMGLGQLPSLSGPMTGFFPGQAVCPEGQRYDPVTTKCVSVTDPGGVASAGRITTGTPNIGGNQCPPGFTFDPETRSCIPGPDTGLLTGGQSQSAQQPMPTCPPNTTLDPVNRICLPKGCPAGYEMDASGNCVAKSMQTPCPPGFTRDATGVCLPTQYGQQPDQSQTQQPPPGSDMSPCRDGYVRDQSGNCVPDPEQEAFFRKYYQNPNFGWEYDIYQAIREGRLSENLVRDFVGSDVVDPWLAQNVDPDRSFSAYAIRNLAMPGSADDPIEDRRGTQVGANRVFDWYQKGAMSLDEIEDAAGAEAVREWMRVNQPAEYNRVYGGAQSSAPATASPATTQFSDADVRNLIDSAYSQYGGPGVDAHRAVATAMNQYGISPAQVARVSGYTPEEVEADYRAFGFADGGAVRFDDLAKKYQSGGMAMYDPMSEEDELTQLVSRYSQASPAARQYEAASQSLRDTLKNMGQADEGPKGPSKAEMYFRLASAFTAPTKTGNFFENLGLAGQEMAGVQAERRAAESAAEKQRRDLALELGRFDVDTASRAMQTEREMSQAMSAAGRQALDEGFATGTPGFQNRVKEIFDEQNLARSMGLNLQERRLEQQIEQDRSRSSRMSSSEGRMLEEAEMGVLQSGLALDALAKALELSPQAYTKSLRDSAAKLFVEKTNPSDPRVVATREMEQLITTNVLQSLKMMFGGNPTEGERAAALATQGLDAISVTERNRILNTLASITAERQEFFKDRINRIRSGDYLRYDEEAEPVMNLEVEQDVR